MKIIRWIFGVVLAISAIISALVCGYGIAVIATDTYATLWYSVTVVLFCGFMAYLLLRFARICFS